MPVLSADGLANDFAVAGRPETDIDRDIEDHAAHHANELGLRVRRRLKMKPPDCALVFGKSMIILHEIDAYSDRRKCSFVIGFGKKSAVVAESKRLDDFDSRDPRGDNFQF